MQRGGASKSGMAAFAVAATLLATPAGAKDVDAITIDVTARVAERCGIVAGSEQGSSSVPDLATAQTLTFGFTVDCNTPFRIGVSSQNGALRLTGAPGARTDDGFSTEKEYRVGLHLETDGAPLDPEVCGSRALADSTGDCAFFGATAGSGLSSGQSTAIGRRGTLTARWQADAGGEVRRVAGTYGDTLTVVIGVRS